MNPIQTAGQKITSLLEQAIEKGETLPWQRPWLKRGQHNASSGRAYNGFNQFLLSMIAMIEGYEHSGWTTFNHAKKAGAKLKKGARGQVVVGWSYPTKEEAEAGKRARSYYYYVFNLSQFEDIGKLKVRAETVSSLNRDASLDEIWEGYADRPEFVEGGEQAAYFPTLDKLSMPVIEKFWKKEAYYATLFHEMIHSTGHKNRLARKGIVENSYSGYSLEELVAEIGASILCQITGIDSQELTDNSVAYLQGWLKQLNNHPEMIVIACQQAQKAVKYILGEIDDTEDE